MIVRWSPKARRGLDINISRIARERGFATGRRWRNDIRSRVDGLAEHPLKGQTLFDSSLRRLVIGPYLVIYRLRNDRFVEIVDVVHGARDLPSLFDRTDDD